MITILLIVFLVLGTETGLRAGLLFFAGAYLTFILKIVIAAPRPYFVNELIVPYSLSTGYGMPSGHATHTTVAMLPVIKAVKRFSIKFALIAFVLTVALSRVYLGVHYVMQVLIGILTGVLLFLFFQALTKPLIRKLWKCNLNVQILLLAIPIVVLLCVDRIGVARNIPEIPANWQDGYNRAVEIRAEEYGVDLDDPRVETRKAEFSLIEPLVTSFMPL